MRIAGAKVSLRSAKDGVIGRGGTTILHSLRLAVIHLPLGNLPRRSSGAIGAQPRRSRRSQERPTAR